MPTNRKMRGEIVNSDSPNWGPLEALVGRDLSVMFMWMFEVELRTRTRFHAYQNSRTRASLYVARDGRCFGFEAEQSYRQISQYQALNGAFDLWGNTRHEHHLLNQVTPRQRAVLEFTRRHASFELLEPGEETVLLAGPGRFDLLEEEEDDDVYRELGLGEGPAPTWAGETASLLDGDMPF
jgi:hypothetical protein